MFIICIYTMQFRRMRALRRIRALKRQCRARKIEGWGVKNILHRELKFKDDDSLKNHLCMNKHCFNLLLTIVQCRTTTHVDTCMKASISAYKRLSLTLRYLATGETFKSLSRSTRIARNIIRFIVVDVLTAIAERLGNQYLRIPKREPKWLKIADEYNKKMNFPNCLGALDGKHIVFKPRKKSDSCNTKCKETGSMVLLALVSADFRFIAIDIGVNGRVRHAGVFSRNLLSRSSENRLHIPLPSPIPGREMTVPYVVLADEAFPLTEYIMKAYEGNELSNDQWFFNDRIGHARTTVEHAFDTLSHRFRILSQPIHFNVRQVELVVKVCCILHNFLLAKSTKYLPTIHEDLNCSLESIPQQGGNHTRKAALEIRDEFQTYFNTCG